MANNTGFDRHLTQKEDPAVRRTPEEVLRNVKLAIATSTNYGRQARQQGSDPYDSRLGRPQGDVWGRGRRPA